MANNKHYKEYWNTQYLVKEYIIGACTDKFFRIVPITRLERGPESLLTRLDAFRAIKLSKLESFMGPRILQIWLFSHLKRGHPTYKKR